jgi:hypothetical protein
MTNQSDKNIPPLKLNGENGLIKVRRSESLPTFPNEELAEEVIFERYDSPLRVQIGRPNDHQKVDEPQNGADTTYFRDTFIWTRNGRIVDIGDSRPGVWLLGFISIQQGSFDDILHETLENGKLFTTIASSHLDIAAVLAGEGHKSILTIARWASVGRFLETVHTAAKEKIPPIKLIKKLSLPAFNRFWAIAAPLLGWRSEHYPYKLIKNTAPPK